MPIGPRSAAVHPGDGRARVRRLRSSFVLVAPFGLVAGLRRDRPADQALRVVSLAGISMPPFWSGSSPSTSASPPRLFPDGGRLAPEYDAPPNVTGPLHDRRAPRREWGLFVDGVPPLLLPASCSPPRRRPAHALHPRRGAGGARPRLRARRAGQGDARRGSYRPLHPAGGAALDRHGLGLVFAGVLAGAVLVEKHLLLAGHRPVRLQERRSISTCPRSWA